MANSKLASYQKLASNETGVKRNWRQTRYYKHRQTQKYIMAVYEKIKYDMQTVSVAYSYLFISVQMYSYKTAITVAIHKQAILKILNYNQQLFTQNTQYEFTLHFHQEMPRTV